ncbi:hypothetical protein TNCV_1369681 [Trichonephila clavipes]|nr:hypothetical protein TNCV_1369681 [Trichonephila clavipes]
MVRKKLESSLSNPNDSIPVCREILQDLNTCPRRMESIVRQDVWPLPEVDSPSTWLFVAVSSLLHKKRRKSNP